MAHTIWLLKAITAVSFKTNINLEKHKCRIDKKCQAYTYNEEQGNIECFLHSTDKRLYVDPWIIVGARKITREPFEELSIEKISMCSKVHEYDRCSPIEPDCSHVDCMMIKDYAMGL